MAERLKFTKAVLTKLEPAAQRRHVYDTECPGLTLLITPSGSKVFYRYGRINGAPRRVRLGEFPALTVDDARTAARQVTGQIAEGKDPASSRRQAKSPATIGDVFDWWLENHAKLRKRTWKEDEKRFKLYLEEWRGLRLSTVTKTMVTERHNAVAKSRGPGAANRQLDYLRVIFKTAIDHDWTAADPTRTVKRFPRQKRKRYLKPHEMEAFFAAVASINQRPQDMLMLCLWTGQRRGNVQSMQWAEVDIDGRMWHIPASKFKTKTAHTVPLVEQAITILDRRWKDRDPHSPWVFPTHSAAGHLMWPREAWKMVLERSKLADLRIHDLRHTMASWQVTTGTALPIVSEMLGHSSASSTSRYAHVDLSAVRQSASTASDAIEAAGTKKS